MMNRLILILLFALFSITVVSQSERDRFDELLQEADRLSHTDKERAYRLLQEMYILVKNSPDSSILRAQTFLTHSEVNLRQGIVDTLFSNQVEKRLEKHPVSLYEEVVLESAHRQNLIAQNDYTGAYALSLQTLNKAKVLNDSLLLAKTLNAMGNINRNIHQFDIAEEYLLEGLKYVPASSDFNHTLKINVFSLYLLRNEPEKEEELLPGIDSLIKEIELFGNTGMLPNMFISLCMYYRQNDKMDKAHDCLTKAFSYSKDNTYIRNLLLLNMGMNYKKANNYAQALGYLKEAENEMSKGEDYRLLITLYENITDVYENMGDLSNALLYAHKSRECYHMNNANSQVMETHRKYINTTLEASENKLNLAKIKVNLKQKQFLLTLLLAIFLVMLSVFGIIVFYQKRKQAQQTALLKEAETKELSARLEKEQQMQQNQAELLENKLREITSYSLLLSNKNQVLKQILSVSERISPADKMAKREIKNIIKDNLQTEDSWNDFMLHFEKVHPLFFEKMQQTYPGISQNELKLASYIRLGLSIKQIAQMLNITPESVKLSRHRLRKKMNLEKEDNMDVLIQNL